MFTKIIVCFLSCLITGTSSLTELLFSKEDLQLSLGSTEKLLLKPKSPINESAIVYFMYEIGNDNSYEEKHRLIIPIPNTTIPANSMTGAVVNVTAVNAGEFILGLNSSSPELKNLDDCFVRITLVHNNVLVIMNAVIGWIYFVAWSVSFYPQVVTNWKRKSVVGLNFDFLAYNITGFLAYGFFNVGMFWVNSVKKAFYNVSEFQVKYDECQMSRERILTRLFRNYLLEALDIWYAASALGSILYSGILFQEEYKNKHPRGINPVQLNDVIFTLHAVFITIITIFQCTIYERGGQKISKVCRVLVVGAWLFIFVSLFVTIGKEMTWLTYLYCFSYVKLGVTLIKYIPQAYMNFKRKSTDGWSIGNVLLDFTGGSFSLLQMFLLAYNSDDWGSIFGDPTKFGLGFFSILFDILFIVQHYVLYRGKTPAYMIIPQTASDFSDDNTETNKHKPNYISTG